MTGLLAFAARRVASAAMDASELRIFEAVARLGGMGRAAAELNTVQSNVTARIRLLEDQLGVALFERYARGVSLTAAGRRLLPYAGRVARLLAEARRAARDDGTPRGRLLLGSLETTAGLRLSPVLAAFAAAHPAVDLSLRTGTTCELIEEVLADRLEGAFVCSPVDHPELVAETVFEEELAVLTAPGVASLDALVRQGVPRIVVLRAGCSYRQRLEAVLARRGVARPRLMEFGTLEAIIGCVAAGLGVTLLPRGLIGPVWREGRVAAHALPAAEALVETVFIRRREAYVSSALTAFLACVRPMAAQAAASPVAA
jgi:LysR family transcriptional regulator, cell division regulator